MRGGIVRTFAAKHAVDQFVAAERSGLVVRHGGTGARIERFHRSLESLFRLEVRIGIHLRLHRRYCLLYTRHKTKRRAPLNCGEMHAKNRQF